MSGLRTFSAPIQKLSDQDIAKRMVWGVATMETDGPDFQNDIVDYNGSLRAFKSWQRNVREMHTNKAVGRCVSVIPMPKEKKILVGVRVSEGAEDTWKKVKDGTLRAFSIGGYPVHEEKRWNPVAKKFVNWITDYRLTELSLVDSPANAECRVTLLTKRYGKKLASDVLADLGETMNKTQQDTREKFSGFAKSLADGDELVLVRKSDLVKGETDGAIVLKADAPVETFTKDEGDGIVSDLDEHDDEDEGDDEDAGEAEEEAMHDLSEAAEKLAEVHDLIHDIQGQECNCGGGGEEGGEPDHEGSEEGEDDLDKSLRLRRGRFMSKNGSGAVTLTAEELAARDKKIRKKEKKRLKKRLNKALGKRDELVLKGLASIEDRLGASATRVMARKGDEEPDAAAHAHAEGGSSNGKIRKTAGTLVSPAAAFTKGDEDAVKSLAKAVRDITTESRELVKKRDNKIDMTPAEQTRLTAIGDDLMKHKIAFQAATGKPDADAFAPEYA